MQYALPLEDTSRLAEAHRRLRAAYGPQPTAFRPDPVTQLVWTMLGTRTRGDVSERAFLNLGDRVAYRWELLPQTPPGEIQKLIKGVTYPEKYAEFLPGTLQGIITRRGCLDLDFLSAWSEEEAQHWLEKLPGVGPKASAAVLNFSRLHQRALVVDTHHLRVACRLGLIPPTSDLKRAARLLTRQIPDSWTADDTEEHHWLMKRLGQDYCHPAKPECAPCPLRPICPEADWRFARVVRSTRPCHRHSVVLGLVSGTHYPIRPLFMAKPGPASHRPVIPDVAGDSVGDADLSSTVPAADERINAAAHYHAATPMGPGNKSRDDSRAGRGGYTRWVNAVETSPGTRTTKKRKHAPTPMARDSDLQALRRRIGALTAAEPEERCPAMALGDEAIDGILPDRGLALGAVHELIPASHGDFAAAIGFALGLLTRITLIRPGPILWCVPAYEASQRGLTYAPGLAAFGFNPGRLLHLTVSKTQDVLWALEEGLASTALAAAIGILPANEKSYDFTASRRLSIRAAQSGVTALLVRHQNNTNNATAAATRWSVTARPSTPVRHRGLSMPGLGLPCWEVSLVRCKRGQPHRWLVEWDNETISFRLAAPLADRAPVLASHAA